MPGGTLFVVATPIGHLGDLTARAVETLGACDRVLAEDTRRTRQLLSHLGIAGKPLERLDAHAGEAEIARAVERLAGGESAALVTDAGTPGVSDPGERLVEAAIAAGVRVVPIPGPSAVLAALVGSGLAATGGSASWASCRGTGRLVVTRSPSCARHRSPWSSSKPRTAHGRPCATWPTRRRTAACASRVS